MMSALEERNVDGREVRSLAADRNRWMIDDRWDNLDTGNVEEDDEEEVCIEVMIFGNATIHVSGC
jgi:hypothetical protein